MLLLLLLPSSRCCRSCMQNIEWYEVEVVVEVVVAVVEAKLVPLVGG